MEHKDYLTRLTELSSKISELPKGYISKKTVSGNVYFYHQWTEGGVKQSRYLHDDEVEVLSTQIEERKKLQAELKDVKAEMTRQPKLRQTDEQGNEVTHMNCTLMHKRIAVAELELDNDTGFIQKIGTVYAPEHLPLGIPIRRGITDRKALNEWWTDRSIPASRSGVREALETLDITNTRMLLIKCYGLSLSDQYWICPEGSGLTWEKVNFFNNGFSDDIGNVLFGSNKKPSNPLDFSSPDNTSDGNLKKRWKIIDGKRCLVKGGSNPFRQQPLNEVIATEIMKRLDIPHVPYTVTWNKGAPYSICEDFIDENTELIPAWRIIQTQKQDNSTSLYQHFLNCCNALGIPGAEEFLDRMITLDYIIANEDRHLNNFGAIRNAETLEWIGMAPIYDSGSSLGYDKITSTMKNAREYTCKPFKKHHEEQLKLVSSFDWVDFAKLSDVQEIITSILSDENATDYMDETRIRVIAELTERRIRNIESLAMSHTRVQSITTEDDVEEDIAEDYGPKMEM